MSKARARFYRHEAKLRRNICATRTATMKCPSIRNLSAAVALAIVNFVHPAAHAADALPTLHANPSRTSVSGLSSGAFMAVQYAVAYSSSVVGLGVIAGGPYNCAFVNIGGVVTCMSGEPSGSMSLAAAEGFASVGQIDPVAGLAKFKVYVFGGTKDRYVHPPVVAATRDFFQAAGVPPRHLAYVNKMPAGHAFIAPAFGNACGTNAAPYIDHCPENGKGKNYDQPKAILEQIYGPLNPPADTLSSIVQPFDQSAFAGDGTSMDSVGFVYIPRECSADASGCAVHVVFHGCRQGAQSVGSDVYASVGYNRWADTNRLIILYPQAVTSQPIPANPEGCWDWWGYTGPTFQVQSGVQLSAVKSMVDRLTAPK
ncbi:extracellular catalytic domain type 2 short-chain-length polyhydroxyalkanoate depolymerase [Variovorax sp. HW608]|uniref:extracellular catalytic domain type 2 short-chain-length polyhydroxyalkanoate depolymerase n=1 Tax=Variovorax sp. HW608 TaxID=1034889 RepID=UPI001E4868E0|nr:depolymerase [Variovorax sp. HW608]